MTDDPHNLSTDEQLAQARKWIVQSSLGIVAYAALIFLAAGRLDWIWGWVWVVLIAAFVAGHPILLIPRDPALLAERSMGFRAPGVKRWDKWLMSAAGIAMMGTWVVPGLDFRYGWTSPFPLAIHLLSLLVVAAGYGLFLWALGSNPFFSEGVRLQTERGHFVARSGPYRFVRHPGYLGAILADLATPLLLGSITGLIPALLFAALYTFRTALEDRTLQDELEGYIEFSKETPYRLVPGIW